MLQVMFLVSLESCQQGGVHRLGSMMLGLVVQKFLAHPTLFRMKLKQKYVIINRMQSTKIS
jgi:hypothetical protein